jgi:hypothetical protein
MIKPQRENEVERVGQRAGLRALQRPGRRRRAQPFPGGGAGHVRAQSGPARQVHDRDQPAVLEVELPSALAGMLDDEVAPEPGGRPGRQGELGQQAPQVGLVQPPGVVPEAADIVNRADRAGRWPRSRGGALDRPDGWGDSLKMALYVRTPRSLAGAALVRRGAGTGELADAGEGIADQEVDDPGAAERGLQLDDARLLGPHVADDRRLLAEPMGAQRGHRRFGRLAGDDRD